MKHKVCILLFLLISSTVGLAAGGGYKSGGILPISEEKLTKAEHVYAEKFLEGDKEVAQLSLGDQLKARASFDPFLLISAFLFLGAIIHTFCAGHFLKIAHRLEEEHHRQIESDSVRYLDNKNPVSFKATLFHFLGEVEAVFALWLIPLLLSILFMKGWSACTEYIDSRNYTEPMFVVVIMAIAASRPVVSFAESAMSKVAYIGKKTPAAWWLSILTVGPLLGSFITEPAAMTICALLLGHQFYYFHPSDKFKYATLGLLFVNVSVGGTLTHFAAPPVLMVASTWDWDLMHMFTNFGWKAALGIIAANTLYFIVFRNEFKDLKQKAKNEPPRSDDSEASVPNWIIFVHLAFLAWTVFTLHHPALFIGGFLFFLAFTIATDHHQYRIMLRGPLLVGLFLAGLVTHGGLQGWWIAPILSALNETVLFVGAICLTAFNDNAAITFLASQVPAFNVDTLLAENLRYAVVAGAVVGGGLTVIANAPNPAGQNLLAKYFRDGIAPLKLLAGALIPTIIMALFFMFF